MRKRILLFGLFIIIGLFFVMPVLASNSSSTSGQQGGSTNWYVVLPAFAIAIASAFGALGQGMSIKAACESVSRNPGAAEHIRFFLIFGLVMVESLVLYTLLIVLIK